MTNVIYNEEDILFRLHVPANTYLDMEAIPPHPAEPVCYKYTFLRKWALAEPQEPLEPEDS